MFQSMKFRFLTFKKAGFDDGLMGPEWARRQIEEHFRVFYSVLERSVVDEFPVEVDPVAHGKVVSRLIEGYRSFLTIARINFDTSTYDQEKLVNAFTEEDVQSLLQQLLPDAVFRLSISTKADVDVWLGDVDYDLVLAVQDGQEIPLNQFFGGYTLASESTSKVLSLIYGGQ